MLAAQTSMDVLRVNNLHVRLGSNGLLADSMGMPAVYTAGGLRLLNNAGVWMSAADSAGNLRLAAHSLLSNQHEFWSGPLELVNEKPSSQALWDKVYAVRRSEIEFHNLHYTDNGYVPVPHIAGWPGSAGTPYAQVLAPFVDLNINDQVYEPAKGDYPYIPSDAMVYSIANDRYSAQHGYTGGLPLGVELHSSIYGFTNDTALNNCVLLRYTVHNRSDRNYSNFRLSAVLNFGIGTLSNDYLGTEIGANALYAINDTSEATFSGRLVSIGCMALNRKISSTMYFENNADPINGRPDSAVHFMRLMQGKWKNGMALNYGSNGVDGSGPADFVFPDTTDALRGGLRWLDQVPGKKVGIMNFDALELKRGKSVTFEFACFFVEEKFNNIKQIGDNCLMIKEALRGRNMLTLVEKTSEKRLSVNAYPNPVKNGDKLYLANLPESLCSIRLISADGREICKLNLDINDNSVILPPGLNQGVYIVECKTLNTLQRLKLILNH